MRRAPVITLSPEQRRVLESQARSRSFPLRVVERARIVLLAASGPAGQGNRRPHGHYTEKSFALAQANREVNFSIWYVWNGNL